MTSQDAEQMQSYETHKAQGSHSVDAHDAAIIAKNFRAVKGTGPLDRRGQECSVEGGNDEAFNQPHQPSNGANQKQGSHALDYDSESECSAGAGPDCKCPITSSPILSDLIDLGQRVEADGDKRNSQDP